MAMNKVVFATGLPELVALKFTSPKEMISNFTDSNGERKKECLYNLVDGRVMFVPPSVAEQIAALGVEKEQEIEVVKLSRKSGAGFDWKVSRAGHVPQQETPRAVGPTRTAVAGFPNAAANDSKPGGRLMMGCLASAIEAAREAEVYGERFGMNLMFAAEDIRSMAISLFIQAVK